MVGDEARYVGRVRFVSFEIRPVGRVPTGAQGLHDPRAGDRTRNAKPGFWLISRWRGYSFSFGLVFVGKRRIPGIRKKPTINGIFRIKIKFA